MFWPVEYPHGQNFGKDDLVHILRLVLRPTSFIDLTERAWGFGY